MRDKFLDSNISFVSFKKDEDLLTKILTRKDILFLLENLENANDYSELIKYYLPFKISLSSLNRIEEKRNSVQRLINACLDSEVEFKKRYYSLLEKYIYFKSAEYFKSCWFASPELYLDHELVGEDNNLGFYSLILRYIDTADKYSRNTIFHKMHFPIDFFYNEYIVLNSIKSNEILNCSNCPDVDIFRESLKQSANGDSDLYLLIK